MIRIEWQDRTLNVRRLVFRPADWPNDGAGVQTLADRAGVDTASDAAAPRAGDFWLGCSPRAGWGDGVAADVGWAHGVISSVAVARLETAARLGD